MRGSKTPQHIPKLFQEIQKVHKYYDELKSSDIIPFQAFKELKEEMDRLRRAAELALRWNHNKGNTS